MGISVFVQSYYAHTCIHRVARKLAAQCVVTVMAQAGLLKPEGEAKPEGGVPRGAPRPGLSALPRQVAVEGCRGGLCLGVSLWPPLLQTQRDQHYP